MASVIGRSFLRSFVQRAQHVQSPTTSHWRGMIRLYSDGAVASKEEIENLVKGNKVVVFMKGVPASPKCGFSNAVVQVLRMHGVDYGSHDVLENDAVRQGIKDFTNWPTIPQVFIDGEFVGGCDIILQMHQNGELIEELKKVGIKSALLKPAEDGDEKKNK